MKQVILMRTDLGMSTGKMCAQASHSVIDPRLPIIVLAVSNVTDLSKFNMLALSMGISTNPVYDAGYTEVPPGTLTCLCIGPADEKEIDSITGSLPLLK